MLFLAIPRSISIPPAHLSTTIPFPTSLVRLSLKASTDAFPGSPLDLACFLRCLDRLSIRPTFDCRTSCIACVSSLDSQPCPRPVPATPVHDYGPLLLHLGGGDLGLIPNCFIIVRSLLRPVIVKARILTHAVSMPSHFQYKLLPKFSGSVPPSRPAYPFSYI